MKFIQNISGRKEINEAELLIEYRNTGDLQLLGSLYENYMPLVYGLCLKYFRDEEKSRDAVMQIFEELIPKLRIHEISNFKSWLYTLARNHCLMAIRSSSKHDFVSVDEYFMETESVLHLNRDEIPEDRLILMEKCMETLSDEQRISVNLFYLEQKCYKEVSEQTGFDLNKVKSFIQNGKRNLKICIEKNGELK
ncbi:sigma-70 family RNA polymerase sigma factor [Daejeonella sp. H1SJ63]|uniref:RNA polymerase sigma factor n=1 Tax=Daejeonella sp. H1SJ63 TaxID=3034145 RepID=UPI0023EB59E7|nr:sigma-70 family RNA polymerase sigma factor [Daejeonella sp. H1SJ63]